MLSRHALFENLIGDLEYHPKRALIYVACGLAAVGTAIFARFASQGTLLAYLFGSGGFTLLLKSVFLLRRTSDGLGVSAVTMGLFGEDGVRRNATVKALPRPALLTGQILQDFGAGAVLLATFLHFGRDVNHPWSNAPRHSLLAAGAVLFGIGWFVRWASSSAQTWN
jgi:hypothetical protein